MEFELDMLDYLSGNKFSNGHKIYVENSRDARGRFEIISDLAGGKNILHIGCADHLELINTKRLEGRWLHDRLCQIANKCVGIDINERSIDYLRNELGIDNVCTIDITGEPSEIISGERWDYAVLGEILEHVNNPCSFLRDIRNNYPSCIDRLIVTVPNALSYNNVKNSKRDLELINTDHRYWFTPYTLAKVATEAGYSPEHYYLCNYGNDGRQLTGFRSSRAYQVVQRIYRLMKGKRYIRNDTIIMVLR